MKVTYIFLAIAIIAALIVLFKTKNKFQWIKAGVLLIFEIFFSTINFIILFLLTILIMRDDEVVSLGSIFFLLAIFIVFSGIMLYSGMRFAGLFFEFTNTTLTLVEYYIQWSLIYVTVYQAIFSNLKHIGSITKFIKVGNFLDPNLLVFTFLPSFISAWIATIMYKRHIDAI